MTADEREALERVLGEHLGHERTRGDGTSVRVYRNEEVDLLQVVREAPKARGGFRLVPADVAWFRALATAAEGAGLDDETVARLREAG